MEDSTPHDEIEAMRQLSTALEPLSADEQSRVLRWAAEKYGVTFSGRSGSSGGRNKEQNAQEEDEPQDAAEFYAKAEPRTDVDRVVIMAYWVQKSSGKDEFEAQPVNSQLKHLGHGVSNITACLEALKGRKPQLVIQLQKSGRSQQARKRYKVTGEGIAEVRRMLAGRTQE